MNVEELQFHFPESLIATEHQKKSRVLWVANSAEPRELQLSQVDHLFQTGDLLVVNNTKVIPCRIYSLEGLEILFVKPEAEGIWQVLFMARDWPIGSKIALPGDRRALLIEKGLPQRIQVFGEELTNEYFLQWGEVALPPYIQRMRGQSHSTDEDKKNYQSDWALHWGSTAAPTASLHFARQDLNRWQKNMGVQIAEITLHVGLGTFLPIKVKDLRNHRMHKEWCSLPQATVAQLEKTKKKGGRIWALGTTVARTLESWAKQKLHLLEDGSWGGETDLFIIPGFEFQMVDVLMTNFHQPQSTLLALVCAFAGKERVSMAYQWAVEREFKLFSYGDLTIWERVWDPFNS